MGKGQENVDMARERIKGMEKEVRDRESGNTNKK